MTAEWHRKINSGVDRRFWALDNDQSMRLIRLYDEGRALMLSYLRTKQEIAKNNKIILDPHWEEIYEQRINPDYGSTEHMDLELEFTAQEIQRLMDECPTSRQLTTELRTIDEQLNEVATKCSEIQLCPDVTQPILSRFPRELRDHIYDLLWNSHDIERLDRLLSFVPFGILPLDKPAVHLPDLQVPIFANPRFVGTEFATEFALRYVRALNAAEIDFRCVRAHLNRDHLGPLDFPFKNFINHLIISIDDTFPSAVFAESAWRDSLDSLLMLKDNRSVKITMYLPPIMQYRRRLFDVLEIARPFFRIFRENSMDVTILGYDFFNPMDDDAEGIFSEQLNHYFDRTPEEWLDMKAKEIKEIPDAEQRKACKGILRAMRMNLGFYKEEIGHYQVTQPT